MVLPQSFLDQVHDAPTKACARHRERKRKNNGNESQTSVLPSSSAASSCTNNLEEEYHLRKCPRGACSEESSDVGATSITVDGVINYHQKDLHHHNQHDIRLKRFLARAALLAAFGRISPNDSHSERSTGVWGPNLSKHLLSSSETSYFLHGHHLQQSRFALRPTNEHHHGGTGSQTADEGPASFETDGYAYPCFLDVGSFFLDKESGSEHRSGLESRKIKSQEKAEHLDDLVDTVCKWVIHPTSVRYPKSPCC